MNSKAPAMSEEIDMGDSLRLGDGESPEDPQEVPNWRDASSGMKGAFGERRLYRSSRCYTDATLDRSVQE